MLRQAIARSPALKNNGVVIYNGVDVEALQAVPRKPTNGKVLGIVGIVPQSKRLDRALDILKELHRPSDFERVTGHLRQYALKSAEENWRLFEGRDAAAASFYLVMAEVEMSRTALVGIIMGLGAVQRR